MPVTDIKEARAMLKRARTLIDVADTWRDSAEKVLYWATCAVDDPGGSSYNDKALALCDRCFKVRTHKSDSKIKNDLSSIKKRFRDVAGFYKEVKATNKFLTVGPPNDPDDIAYAVVNGWKTGDKNGLTFVIARCKTSNDEQLTDIITHESVHFAAGIGHYDINGKAAYGNTALTLTNSQALKNASNYAWLAYFCTNATYPVVDRDLMDIRQGKAEVI